MKNERRGASGPQGGLRAGVRATRAWRWEHSGTPVSAPVRCRRAQWYLARGRLADGASPDSTEVVVHFVHVDHSTSTRTLALHAVTENGAGADLLGWVQAPEDATHVQLQLADAGQARRLAEVMFHPVAERDPKCHPLANVPRWSSYRPPFPLERVLLSPELECLAGELRGQQVEIIRPRSTAQLARAIRGAACVCDPGWAAEFGWRWADLVRLASESWLIVDLETAWKLVQRAKLARWRLRRQESTHGMMSARVEYGDVATRGFALQDVFPYATTTAGGGFALRGLHPDRAWKRYADQEGFATLLASETPDPDECGDILSAACAAGRGDLLLTDLPWLVAGQLGRSMTPRLARHALRMHLGGPLDDSVQYWNRWDEGEIVVRDISDLARRYPPLQAVRWAARGAGVVPLGVALPASGGVPAGRTLLFRTGRIDNLAAHDGLPPEPLIIFMKMLAREVRQQSSWAGRYLRDVTVVWQFDTAAGVRYAANYGSAAPAVGDRTHALRLARVEGGVRLVEQPAAASRQIVSEALGIFGDGSLEYQRQLNAQLRAVIAQH